MEKQKFFQSRIKKINKFFSDFLLKILIIITKVFNARQCMDSPFDSHI